MDIPVQGMTAHVERIIHNGFVPCVCCTHETPQCVKLYKEPGSIDAICAELSD